MMPADAQQQDRVRVAVGIGSGLSAVVSLIVALRVGSGQIHDKFWGNLILALWLLAPPLWFILEYSLFRPKDERARRMEHLHDLGRNLWIAYVAVLSAVMGVAIKLPS